MIIPTPDYRLRIFVNSTLIKLAEERKACMTQKFYPLPETEAEGCLK